MVPSWDGTPIDVSVAFPPASGPDNNYPVVGIYHGYGGTKIKPSSSTAQRWLAQGYAVFSITDRGFGESCGTKSPAIKTPACAHGYIHLMSRRYEVRDAQYLLGLLADEGVINPQEIGATGASYGGGMSSQLGSLKDRVELPNGELIPWVSPKGTSMKIAATAPELTWTDLSQSLQPNGSNLDYVANAPYAGVLGNHEFGIQKQNWNTNLYFGGLFAGGFYAPSPAEPEANITEWFNFNNTGGPYNGQPLAVQQETQLPYHGAYYTNLSEPPAPVLFEDGWDDDLFPADQGVDYYNKVRATYPTAAIEFWGLDYGHNPRSANASAADIGRLFAAQNAWFAYYIRGEGSEPAGAHGGVTAIVSHCPATAAGSEYKARNWASLAPGEIRLEGATEQTVEAPGIAPEAEFVGGTTVCTTEAAGENASAATYKLTAPAGGFTIAGSPTVIGEFSTPGTNAQLIARLYDVNEAEGTQQLIGRAIYRPISPGGFTKQVFQIHPQAWNVAAGHVVKLELLAQDSTYARNSSTPQSIKVKNLELRLPTIEPPGSDSGLVQSPLPKYLPPGYTLALGNYTQGITGTVRGPLVVKAGHVVELASTGKISGPVRVEAGGAFDIEGGTVSGPVTANKAARLLLCGATISGPVGATNGTGPVVIGGPGCPGNTIAGRVTVTGNTAGVLIEGNVIKGPLTVTGNEGGTTVTNNTVVGPLTVTGNTGVVVDKPNVVMGPSKLQ